ncbi:hypothetical protein KJ660_00565, partial [Candidatus Micrarchaeota archaeon]|nr:hypothetical protein [Candidatus Micrarchaeota archaeon]
MNEINYSLAGVDRKEREKAKKFGLFEKGFSGKVIRTPFNNLFPFPDSKDYYCFCADGVGTKVLLAQLAGKHDSIGIDGVAMVVNDAVRSGAKPVSLVNIIDAKKSNAEVLKELIEGINKGAKEAECTVAGGETADLGEMISGIGENAYHINFACIGTVKEKEIIKGDGLKKGDKVIGLRSNGLHSNGISLARRVLFKEWNGYYEKDAYSEELKG